MFRILKLTVIAAVLMVSFKPALADWPDENEWEYERGIIHTPNPDLDVDVWIDKGEGARYYPGEEIYIYFRASRDCYVVVYNLDTKGYVNILYPYDHYDEPWVEGGRVYRIPSSYDDYSLTIDGPSGVEYIQAVASYEPLSPPNWPGYHGGMRPEPEEIITLRMDEDEDPYVFMEWVNHRIRPYYDYVTDICHLYVRYPHPRWYYRPHLYGYYPYNFPYQLGGVYIWAPFAVEVYIDGIFFGIAPLTIPEVVIGRHYVTYYYNGCRVWDNYIYVEKSKTIRVRANISDRVRYVSRDPVKKDYRTWKEKEYRHVRERISAQVEKNTRTRYEYTKSKSSREEGKIIREKERDRTKYKTRDEMRKNIDVVPEKQKINERKIRDKKVIEHSIKSEKRKVTSKEVVKESKSVKSNKAKQKSIKIQPPKSSKTSRKSIEAKKAKTVKRR